MASLDVGSGSGQDVLNGVSDFLDSGGTIGTLLTSSVIGLIVSPIIGLIDLIDAVFAFFSVPFAETADSVADLQGAFLQAPARLLESGAQISESAIASVFGETVAGIFALPITVGIVVLSLFMVVQYLQEDETGDTLPGLPVDVPDVFGLELGVQEEGEDEDE
jgi:hypothetical protein